MGQKVHPHVFRLGVVYTWKSRWFSRRNYREILQNDITLRRYLRQTLRGAGVSQIEIERSSSNVTVTIHTAKPGLVIGRGGVQAEQLKQEIKKRFLKPEQILQLNIQELSNPMMSAQVLAETMALELEKRMPFRRVMKQAMDQAMKAGALGVKVMVGGRLNGAEIARSEKLGVGTVPLHTIRTAIDYARTAARTTYGVLGIKVWVNRGESLTAPVATSNLTARK